jgi:SAM-dependent methyltransferase|tara:strand:- start:600 stop:1280 length:681 start_codon:yes stop_codon:yes gene_type:complete
MENYPSEATEKFDNAKFHRKYCMSFVKKFIQGEVLEVGAGCGSFTRDYFNSDLNITLTETDQKNYEDLKKFFYKKNNVTISNNKIFDIDKKFDTILYLHVLEHIEEDRKELESAYEKLKKGGRLIIMVPKHQKLYSNFDKAIGHFRRYELDFFEKNLINLERKLLISLDSVGYILYFLNKIFFKNETFPSYFKIFIWDKIFTPFTILLDFFTNYRFGKCIVAVYKK